MGQKKVNVEPQIRYSYKRSKSNTKCNYWIFLVVDQPGNIESKITKIHSLLAPIRDEDYPKFKGKIQNSNGMAYEVTGFDSSYFPNPEQISGLDRRVREDLNLHGGRGDPDWLEKYVAGLFRR